MPSPASSPALSDIQLEHGLLLGIANELIPLFTHGNMDRANARSMALSALQAYQPETHADYVNIARTIAFSMSALALLGHAAAKDVPMPEKLRAFGRANALNRSADQSERTMMQRRSYHQAQAPASSTAPAPDPYLDDATAQALVAEAVAAARAEIQAAEAKTNPLETKSPEAAPSPAVARAVPLAAIQAALHPQRPTEATPAAIRYNPPNPVPRQAGMSPSPGTSPYKDGPLLHSAIHGGARAIG
jgi:hypothetical protein